MIGEVGQKLFNLRPGCVIVLDGVVRGSDAVANLRIEEVVAGGLRQWLELGQCFLVVALEMMGQGVP